MHMPLFAALAALALAATPLLAEEGWPRSIAHEAGALTLEAQPQRIVSTSPSLTGTLLAIDAPLTATAAAAVGPLTDDQGFFTQWAEVAHERGVEALYRDLTFDIEAVILAEPDLVVVSATGGDSVLPFVSELESLGYPVMVLDYGINPWEELARTLGRASGHEADAAQVIEDFAATASEVSAGLELPEGSVSIVSYNFFGSYGISKPESAQARVLAEMGLTVTGLPEEMRGAVTASREFDFISHENLPAAITGDSVFLLAADEGDVETFLSDPVLGNLPAVREGRVYPLGKSSFRVDYYSGLAMIDTVARQFAQ